MKFILNKCKVIQLGKYNLTPWRLGERHLESSDRSGWRDSEFQRDLGTDSTQAFLSQKTGQVCVTVSLSATLPGVRGMKGPSSSEMFGSMTEAQIPNVPSRAQPLLQPHPWVRVRS